MHNSAILLVSCPDRKGCGRLDCGFHLPPQRQHSLQRRARRRGIEPVPHSRRVRRDIGISQFDVSEFGERFAPHRARLSTWTGAWRTFFRPASHRHLRLQVRPLPAGPAVSPPERRPATARSPLIVSNHADNQRIADFYQVPYVVSCRSPKENKRESGAEADSRSCAIVNCSDGRAGALHAGPLRASSSPAVGSPRIIVNIHHSFPARIRRLESPTTRRFSAG
jgi:hypothetical protein